MRGVTLLHSDIGNFCTFQLTRLMRGVTDGKLATMFLADISTHTPHARRDGVHISGYVNTTGISTHTPHARRDCRYSCRCAAFLYFNSHASCEA